MSSIGRWMYLSFCLATCGYLYTAAANQWVGPSFASGASSATGGHSYSTGFFGGRSSGGFGGGGK